MTTCNSLKSRLLIPKFLIETRSLIFNNEKKEKEKKLLKIKITKRVNFYGNPRTKIAKDNQLWMEALSDLRQPLSTEKLECASIKQSW